MLRAVTAVLALILAAPAAARADIIVKREPGLSQAEQADLRADAGVKHVESLPLAATEVVKAAPGEQAEALAALNADPDVLYAEADRPVHALAADALRPSQWALSNPWASGADISAFSAWELSRGAGVTVGVVDTGVDAAHPDLLGQTRPRPRLGRRRRRSRRRERPRHARHGHDRRADRQRHRRRRRRAGRPRGGAAGAERRWDRRHERRGRRVRLCRRPGLASRQRVPRRRLRLAGGRGRDLRASRHALRRGRRQRCADDDDRLPSIPAPIPSRT